MNRCPPPAGRRSGRMLILIGGASGSGKTGLAERLTETLGPNASTVLPVDAYYHGRPPTGPRTPASFNVDTPDAIDAPLLGAHVDALLAGRDIVRPIYDYRRHRRLDETMPVTAAPCLVVEGLLALHWPALRARGDLAVFITATPELALSRRINRDVKTRGRSEASVRAQWEQTVWPMYLVHVAPTRRFADVVLDGADDLQTSVATLLRHIAPGTPPRP